MCPLITTSLKMALVGRNMYEDCHVYINYCPVTAGINLCTNFAVLRARILLMLVSVRPQCALSVHRTTTHSLLASLNMHRVGVRSAS